MRIRSDSDYSFATVPHANIPRSSFNRSHGCKTTFDAGYLVPVFLDEALPGDTFNLKMTAFARLATPIFPIMDNMYLDSFFFAVPVRLLWDNWEKFNGAQDDPDDSTDFVVPQIVSPAVTGYTAGSLFDYFGIPTEVPGLTHSALFSRAYNLIYNEWFRDQNIQDSVVVDRDDGPDSPTDYVLLRRGKRHDYFTSCLPWPQKGTAVSLPLGTLAPVIGIGAINGQTTSANQLTIETSGDAVNYANAYNGGMRINASSSAAAGAAGSHPEIYADLSAATAATINQLREAFQIQKLYERDARGGTRYTEVIRSHFGVISPDARLQRPEYLGGGSSPINISAVAQTSETDTTPLATLSAIGTVTALGHGFTKSFTEHCVIVGMVSARADLNYQQGLNRMFSRNTRFDYYWPALSHIGEQAVLNKEIYAQGTADLVDDEAAFGYQERYAEYRYKPSIVTGQFRSNFATSLDSWHLAQDFTALPTLLDPAFIVENPPVDRVLAVNSGGDTPYPHFIFDSHFDYHCARPMPVNSVPGLIDHF